MKSDDPQNPQQPPEVKPLPPPVKLSMLDFIITLLSPLIIGKSLVFYFGTMYSSHPGQGYGYAMIAAICFTLGTLGRFLWKYRHYNDE
ncbi:MAG: hypothetical protein M9899_10930 [Bdellovibrionaceae bacterium]|nr:hypothetical protein [Pseudobdellovibrionaceae bacterium]